MVKRLQMVNADGEFRMDVEIPAVWEPIIEDLYEQAMWAGCGVRLIYKDGRIMMAGLDWGLTGMATSEYEVVTLDA